MQPPGTVGLSGRTFELRYEGKKRVVRDPGGLQWDWMEAHVIELGLLWCSSIGNIRNRYKESHLSATDSAQALRAQM